MGIVHRQVERIEYDTIRVCVCDTCGREGVPSDEYSAFPEGWILIRKVDASLLRGPDPNQGTDTFCSWSCASTYAMLKSERVAAPV